MRQLSTLADHAVLVCRQMFCYASVCPPLQQRQSYTYQVRKALKVLPLDLLP